MTLLASDDFNRADANTLGTSWNTFTVGGEQIGIATNRAKFKSLGSGDAYSSYNITWPNDQYSEAMCIANNAGEGDGVGCGVAVRMDTGGALTLYRAVVNTNGGGQVQLSKVIAGVYTLIANVAVTWFDDDLLRLEVSGTTLRLYRNNGQIGTNYTDSSVSSGRAGVAYSSTAGANNSLNSWSAGSLDAVAGGGASKLLMLGVG